MKEYFGVSCLKNVRAILELNRATRVFLVTGDKSFFLSGAQDAIAPYLENKAVVRFSTFSVNPKINDVIKGIAELKQAGSDAIIAIGGGSTIDMAKLVNVLAPSEHEPQDIITGKQKIGEKGLPLIAIPTTAGSGSEATHFAVVYIDHTKYSLAHEFVLPDYSIIDPSLTYSQSPRLTAVCGFDALCQAVESYWAVTAMETSLEYAAESIKLGLSSLVSAVNSPGPDNREAMAFAAHLAGKAINITKTTAPHAVSYPLTTFFNIPHGHAVALLLGKFFTIHSQSEGIEWRDSRGKEYGQKVMQELSILFSCTHPLECSEKWYQLMTDAGLETDFASLGISNQSDIDRIVNNVNIERLDNNPVIITDTIIRKLFSQS